MTCAFDGDAFDAVAFDVCIPVPSGGAVMEPRYYLPPLRERKDDDEEVLAMWFYLEEM